MKTETETAALPAKQRKTGLRRQTVATIVLAGLLVLLTVAQIIASGLVKIYTIKDTYIDENGVVQTVKYTVKRDPQTGLYALYNKKGEQMKTAPDNNYNNYKLNGQQILVFETEVGGNQYRINTSTGEYSLYAAVDAEGDEVLGGTATNTRLLMFGMIDESRFSSLEVTNRSGRFRIKKAESGRNLLSVWNGEGWVQSAVNIDAQALSNLRVNCGYTLTTQKLDLSSPAAPRLEDGSINYAAYGLDETSAENPPASYTITATGTNGESYTVLVGDQTVAGNGYYVKRADKNAVYILDTGIEAVLSPVESLVAPTAIYPLGETTYPMVQNFFLLKVRQVDMESEQMDSEIITAFSYWDLDSREYTVYQTSPYVIPENITFLNGYTISDWDISELLARLYELQYLSCKKFMPDYDDLAAYGLTENFHYLEFYYNTGANGDSSGPYVHNALSISKKMYDEELGQEVYYLYSAAPAETENPSLFEWGGDMIVAVDPYYFSFVEWEQRSWYDPYYFQPDLAFLRELHLTFGEKEYDFYLDNSKTNQSKGLSVDKLEIVCPQYGEEGSDHNLNYQVHTVQTTDTGEQAALDYTGIQNFKRFVSKLFMGVIEGDVNAAQFQAATGKTVAEFIASDTADDLCIAKLRYHLEDYAVYNSQYWDQNNTRDIVLRFYAYDSSGRKALLTVEVLERDANGNLILNEDGEPFSDPTRANGLFYVNTSALGVFAGYAEDLLNQALIPQ